MDINKSKVLGSEISTIAEKCEGLRRVVYDTYAHTEFLKKEINYNNILVASIKRIKSIKKDIDTAEQMIARHETMPAVKMLAEVLQRIHSLPNYHRIRAFTLLEDRALDVGSSLHQEFEITWNSLIHVNTETRTIQISHSIDGEFFRF